MILNLDSNFNPINGDTISHDAFTFSGGEPHIKIAPFDTSLSVTVTQRVMSFNDMGLLLIAVDALRRMGVKRIDLVLPYFPAARQDRWMIPGESLSVKVYADLINGMQLDKVTIFDPHSEVTPALLDNCKVVSNHTFIASVIKSMPDNVLLVSPDAGAAKKIHKLANFLQDYEVLECGKSRDVKTGALSGFKVPTNDLKGRNCLLVDDICDGGGTFLGLAKVLKESNSGNLYLAVSHGIFSKGLEHLSDTFDKIYTTDSLHNSKENKISVVQIGELI